MNRGYIKLFRKITDNCIYNSDEPFDKRSAWIDLILLANHKDNYVYNGMKKVIVKRGQHKTSISKLQERWHWGEKKVDAFLGLLQNEGMIYYEKNRSGLYRGVLITIVNYGVYQDFLKERTEQTAEQNAEQTAYQAEIKGRNKGRNKLRINNNDKNDIKNDIKNESKNVNKPAAQRDFFGEVKYEE